VLESSLLKSRKARYEAIRARFETRSKRLEALYNALNYSPHPLEPRKSLNYAEWFWGDLSKKFDVPIQHAEGAELLRAIMEARGSKWDLSEKAK
jgi:hypothetical protein